jgi:hypothetical protein
MSQGNPAFVMPATHPAYRLLATYAALAALVLWLPWLVPVQPVRSDSFVQGFSNAAFLAFLLLLFIAPVFLLYRSRELGAAPGSLRVEAGAGEDTSRLWLRSRALSWYVGCCAFILLVSGELAGYGEAEYFLVRSLLVAAGKVPYRDFEYAYGPLLLYAPMLLQSLGFPAGFSQAVLVVLESVAGYGALYFLTMRIFPRAAGRTMFLALLLASCLSPVMAGQNYTFFRFAAVIALAAYILPRVDAARAPAFALLSGPLFLLAWLISPEIALVAGGAFAAIVTMLASRKLLSAAAAAASVAACVLATPLALESYETLLQFSSGGNNFPAYPAWHILFFLLCIHLSTAFIARKTVTNHRAEWLLFIYSVGLLPGALGRCDPLHVVFYGFGFLLLAGKFCLDSGLFSGVFRKYCMSCGIGFFITWLAMYAAVYPYAIPAAIARTMFALLSEQNLGALVKRLPASFQAAADTFREADSRHQTLLASRGADVIIIHPRSDMVDLQRVHTPYFVTLHNAVTRSAFDRLAAEIDGKTVLMRTSAITALCGPLKVRPKVTSMLFLFPTGVFEWRNDPVDVTRKLCAAIKPATVIFEGELGGYTELQVGS